MRIEKPESIVALFASRPLEVAWKRRTIHVMDG